MMRKFFFAVLTAALAPLAVSADSESYIRELLDSNDNQSALKLAEEELGRNPKGATLGTYSMLAGEAAYNLRQYDKAEQYLSTAMQRGMADAYRLAGKMAFEDMRFSKAKEYYSKYVALKDKARKQVVPSTSGEIAMIDKAVDMMDRVENIVVVDSLHVPQPEFFKAYKLSPSAGTLTDRAELPFVSVTTEATAPVYKPEDGSLLLWAQVGAGGYDEVYQSDALLGGGWTEPQKLANLGSECNVAYPFLTADGTTLYFASDGEDSLGGLDIFRANRDTDTSQFRYPVNMGLPYNSPADDYMLAIDEESGLGWWATDRNRLDGSVTIYIFIPNEVRRNYDVATPNLESLARLDDYKLTTQGREDDVKNARSVLDSLSATYEENNEKAVYLPDGRRVVVEGMQCNIALNDWQKDAAALAMLENELRGLRASYHENPSDETAARISDLEKKRETMNAAVISSRGRFLNLVEEK